jgi:hypothetical protein
MGLIFDERTRRLRAQLHPDLAKAWDTAISLWLKQFPGCTVGISQAYRTPDQQKSYYEGRTSPYDGVTSFSKHQFYPSHAFDVAILGAFGKLDWNAHSPLWDALGGHLTDQPGVMWGRSFHRPDSDHFELLGANPTAVEVSDGRVAFLNMVPIA